MPVKNSDAAQDNIPAYNKQTTVTTKPNIDKTKPNTDTTTPVAGTTAPATETTTLVTSTGEFYVSPGGNDSNPGTKLKPWKTIKKATNTIVPGDTVFIRAGVYSERVVLQSSGTADNYITFKNYPGEHPIIDGTGIDWDGGDWEALFSTQSKDYIIIDGLRIINSKWIGIGEYAYLDGGARHIVVRNCSTFNTRSSGIHFSYGADITIDSNIIEYACAAGTNDEALHIEKIDGFEVKYNQVLNSHKEGIDILRG